MLHLQFEKVYFLHSATFDNNVYKRTRKNHILHFAVYHQWIVPSAYKFQSQTLDIHEQIQIRPLATETNISPNLILLPIMQSPLSKIIALINPTPGIIVAHICDFSTTYPRSFVSFARSGSLSCRKILSMFRLISCIPECVPNWDAFLILRSTRACLRS